MTASLDPDPRRARFRIAAGAAVLLVVVGLGAAVLVTLLSPSGATAVVSATGTAHGSGSSTGASSGSGSGSAGSSSDPAGATPDDAATGAPGSVYVHVVGHVAAPGLYRLDPGARVVDAVAAAGGLAPDADAAAVNLARPVSDGEQLVVPAVGEAPPAAAGTGTAGGAGPGGAAAPGAKVDINTADQTALETLPRVGPALAQRILAWRQANGRFASIDDLRSVSGIGDKTFEQLKDLVTV